MMINSAYNTAVTGLANAQYRLDTAAQEIAGAVTQRAAPPVSALLDTKSAERDAEANIKAIKTADETLGSLLDIMA